jgi:hypothetical protein
MRQLPTAGPSLTITHSGEARVNGAWALKAVANSGADRPSNLEVG